MLNLLLSITVLCIGNSMTDPQVVTQNYCDISIHETTNIGASFTRALDWAALTQTQWAEYGVFDVAHIMLGSNDAIFDRTALEVRTDIETIAANAQALQVVISLQPLALGAAGEARNELLAQYHEAMLEAITADPRLFMGVDWTQLPGHLTPEYYKDGLHPNAATHALASPIFDAAITAVPEPGSFLQLLTGMCMLAVIRRRR